MNLEIERRFIVDVAILKKSATHTDTQNIIQAYFQTPFGTPTTRLRAITNRLIAFQTTKIKRANGVHQEYEYAIPYSDCLDIIDALDLKFEKTRRIYIWKDSVGKEFMFEVDTFNGLDVVIAEVELESMDELTEIPEWCLREVTNESGISNYAIAEDRDTAYYKLRKLAASTDND